MDAAIFLAQDARLFAAFTDRWKEGRKTLIFVFLIVFHGRASLGEVRRPAIAAAEMSIIGDHTQGAPTAPIATRRRTRLRRPVIVQPSVSSTS